MKTLFLAALLCALLLCASCHRSDNANPIAPTTGLPIAGSVSFQTSLDVHEGGEGLRVSFSPSVDVTISRVIIAPAGSMSIDTVVSSEPSRVFNKGKSYTLDGYLPDGWGAEGLSWKFTFTGKVEPADTQYTCASEWEVF